MTTTDATENVALDSHILIDTDYIRNYLQAEPGLLPEEIEPDTDEFHDAVDRIVDAALKDDCLHDEIRDVIRESWLWESLTDMVDDVLVGFIHDQSDEIAAELDKKEGGASHGE